MMRAGRFRRKSLYSKALRHIRIFQETPLDKPIKNGRINEKEKRMIKIELTVREALTMISNGCSLDMFEKIVCALEVALGVNQKRKVTITKGMDLDNRIPCIKAVRQHTGWGLKEAKEWTDGMVGGWDASGFLRGGGNTISLTTKTPEAAEQLLRDLTTLGCEGYLS